MKLTIDTTKFSAKQIPIKKANSIREKLFSSKTVDIFCHQSTDRDSANSALAMWEYLKQKGVEAKIVLDCNLNEIKLRNENVPVVKMSEYNPDKSADSILCLDFSEIKRVKPNLQAAIKTSKNVIVIDHHTPQNIAAEEEVNNDSSPYYIDTSALSATSIIYRYFEALGDEIDENMALDLFSGLVSDGIKKNYIDCNGKNGTILAKKELLNNPKMSEIFFALKSKISEQKIKELAKNIDIMSNLSNAEKDFYCSLFDRVQMSKNGKIAYVALDVDDETWIQLGRDNERTSKILNTFRQDILQSRDSKYRDVEIVFCFYEAKDEYRLSVHSKTDLSYIYNKANKMCSKKYEGFSIGGHECRGGGKISSLDDETCCDFIKDIISISESQY